MSKRRYEHGTRRMSPWGRVIEEEPDEGASRKWIVGLVVLGLLALALVLRGACSSGGEEGDEPGSASEE